MFEHPDLASQMSEKHELAQSFMRVIKNPKTPKNIRREAVNGLCGYTHIEGVVVVLMSVMENPRIDKETRLIATIGLSEHTYPDIHLEDDGESGSEVDA